MTSPLPIDTSGIDEPLPDLAHEAIRLAVLNAITAVWAEHQSLVAQVADLTARVAALEPPVL